ncbi:uncharacterized protein LOC121412258 [Lytechinus variegatus]|uniref:uncharacterized protein LOC121412258 n=1 Tax=Lytechinus variegatus TaxID=7654 RepID=UPI001BB16AF4|nr:uncharacterized protein LOC121412258 [Lytechinus variegatus]
MNEKTQSADPNDRRKDVETSQEAGAAQETDAIAMKGYSRKPVKVKFPKCWEFMTQNQRRENVIDKYSIYGSDSPNSTGLPIPGQRSAIVQESSDIGWREERGYIKRVTGFPPSACVNGIRNETKRRVRHLSPIRLPTANTICDEYNWMHNGVHGKMLLSNKKYRHILRSDLAETHDPKQKLHYCEVLGQRVCADCIEHTNRTMAIEYQHEAFPEIEVTASRLIAPKLSKLLADRLKSAVPLPESEQQAQESGLLGNAQSPPPYRQPSALRNQRHVTIYSDAMINSLHQTLKRDRRMTAETLHDVRELRLKRGKRATMRQLPLEKLNEANSSL